MKRKESGPEPWSSDADGGRRRLECAPSEAVAAPRGASLLSTPLNYLNFSPRPKE